MIKPYFIKVEKAFNGMTLRERIISFAALFICVVCISYFWMVEPAQIKQSKIEKTLSSSYQKERELKQEIARVQNELKKDPLQEINTKIAFSKKTLQGIDLLLEEKLVKFIRAQKMPVALTKMLSKTPGVKIESLVSLPVKVFNTGKKSATSETADSSQQPFYQHTLAVKLSGDYNSVYRYLLNLESIPEKFYWSAFNYKVIQYPLAQVTIEIYTLSDQQDLVSG